MPNGDFMQNIIVTGAAGNSGKAAIQRFLEKNYRVHGTLRPDSTPDLLDNEKLFLYEVDLLNEDSCTDFIKKVNEQFGEIHGAAMLAGGFSMGNIQTADQAAISQMLNLNFKTAYNIARPVFKLMFESQKTGTLIFIGAMPALKPEIGKDVLAYALSKSLLFNLVNFLNAEGKSKSIISKIVVPGIIDTSQNRKAMPDADFSKWNTPESLAEIIETEISKSAKDYRTTVIEAFL